ncbi:MAG: CPBP family intramembrane metalloprotease [Anaerolineales bacterium]|nr:CPBP family intramembrane metalloprotease [Anaerolineales bacterium]
MQNDYLFFIKYIPFLIVWGVLFFYSFKFKLKFPWGFGFILLWIMLPNQGISFQQNGIIYFGVSVPFLIAVMGLLLNVSKTKPLLFVKDVQTTSLFILLGIFYVLIVLYLAKIYSWDENFSDSTKITLMASIFLATQASLEEEALFRGFLFNYLRSYNINPLVANFLQSLFFVLSHIRKYSDTPSFLIEIFIFGFLAGYFTWKSRNLIPAFFMHVLINTIPLILRAMEFNVNNHFQ